MIDCHTHVKLATIRSATPHESQPTAVSHARGKYARVPKTTPPTEAMPSQVTSTRERSGRRATNLARAVLMRRLGSTTLRAIGGQSVQSDGTPTRSEAGLTKVTPSSGSVDTCCSGRPAQNACEARADDRRLPHDRSRHYDRLWPDSRTGAHDNRGDHHHPTSRYVVAGDRAGTHVCPRTDGQQVECCSDAEGVHARPRTDARTQQAQPRIEQGRADQKVAEQHVVAVQSRLDEPVAQVPPAVERVFARLHAAQYCPLECHCCEHVEQSCEHQTERQQHRAYESASVVRHKGGAEQSRTERQRPCHLRHGLYERNERVGIGPRPARVGSHPRARSSCGSLYDAHSGGSDTQEALKRCCNRSVEQWHRVTSFVPQRRHVLAARWYAPKLCWAQQGILPAKHVQRRRCDRLGHLEIHASGKKLPLPAAKVDEELKRWRARRHCCRDKRTVGDATDAANRSGLVNPAFNMPNTLANRRSAACLVLCRKLLTRFNLPHPLGVSAVCLVPCHQPPSKVAGAAVLSPLSEACV
eukprot:scaffold28301_cov70-Phaeocystis_antarctica.AAC.3